MMLTDNPSHLYEIEINQKVWDTEMGRRRVYLQTFTYLDIPNLVADLNRLYSQELPPTITTRTE